MPMNKRTGITITIAIILLLIVGGIIGGIFLMPSASQESVGGSCVGEGSSCGYKNDASPFCCSGLNCDNFQCVDRDSNRFCGDYGQVVGNKVYFCLSSEKVGVTDCPPHFPPDYYESYWCPNHDDLELEGLEVCKNNKCVVSPIGEIKCLDTDGGRDLKTKGDLTISIGGNPSYPYSDECHGGIDDNAVLTEFSCDGSDIVWESGIRCDEEFGKGWGCENGRCKEVGGNPFCEQLGGVCEISPCRPGKQALGTLDCGTLLEACCRNTDEFCRLNPNAPECNDDECGYWIKMPEILGGAIILPDLWCIINNFIEGFKIVFSIVTGFLAGILGLLFGTRLIPKKTNKKWAYLLGIFVIFGVAVGVVAFFYFWYIMLALLTLAVLRFLIPGV